jgi:hypothetical protein
VSRIYDIPNQPYIFYAGVARPQALYMILPSAGRLHLYRGAVLSYREFVDFKNVKLNDDTWQRMIRARKTPPAPAFTDTFLAPD